MCFQKQHFFFLSQIIPPRSNGAGTSSQLLQCSMCLCQIGELMDIGGNRPLLFWRCFPLRLWVTGKSENESKPNTSQISHQNPMETLLWFFSTREDILEDLVDLTHYVDTRFILTLPRWTFLFQSALSKLFSLALAVLLPWNQYVQTVWVLTGAQNAEVRLGKSFVHLPEKFNLN